MNFPTIEIPDPAAVSVWLDHVIPEDPEGSHIAAFDQLGWHAMHLGKHGFVSGRGDTPEALLADIQRKLAERDPVIALRKQAEAAGFALTPLATL